MLLILIQTPEKLRRFISRCDIIKKDEFFIVGRFGDKKVKMGKGSGGKNSTQTLVRETNLNGSNDIEKTGK